MQSAFEERLNYEGPCISLLMQGDVCAHLCSDANILAMQRQLPYASIANSRIRRHLPIVSVWDRLGINFDRFGINLGRFGMGQGSVCGRLGYEVGHYFIQFPHLS